MARVSVRPADGVAGQNAKRRKSREAMDDFLAYAAAEVIERVVGAVIGERLHGHGVAVQECRCDRPFDEHRRLAPFEQRRVTAFRQVDDQLVGRSLFTVVADQFRAQASGLNAYDGVRSRIECVLLVEHLNPYDILLQLVSASGDRFKDDEPQKPLQPVALLERGAAENSIELFTYSLVLVCGDVGCSRRPAGHQRYLSAPGVP